MFTTGQVPMNFTPDRSDVSNPLRLLEQAEMRAEKFLPVRERAIVITQSLDGAGILFPIVRPALQSLLTGLCAGFFEGSLSTSSPLSLCNFLFFGGGSSRGSSRDDLKISEFHDIVRLIKLISINSAYYW